jgi:hypothetical protein
VIDSAKFGEGLPPMLTKPAVERLPTTDQIAMSYAWRKGTANRSKIERRWARGCAIRELAASADLCACVD